MTAEFFSGQPLLHQGRWENKEYLKAHTERQHSCEKSASRWVPETRDSIVLLQASTESKAAYCFPQATSFSLPFWKRLPLSHPQLVLKGVLLLCMVCAYQGNLASSFSTWTLILPFFPLKKNKVKWFFPLLFWGGKGKRRKRTVGSWGQKIRSMQWGQYKDSGLRARNWDEGMKSMNKGSHGEWLRQETWGDQQGARAKRADQRIALRLDRQDWIKVWLW